MTKTTVHRLLAVLGALGGLLALGLLAISILTGVSQEAFEMAMPRERFAALARSAGFALRLGFTVDFFFIATFTSFFVFLAIAVREELDPTIGRIALGAMLFTGLLDVVEDTHILAMLATVEAGGLPSQGEIGFQAAASATKFFASYLALFLFSFGLSRADRWETLLRVSLRYFQLPIGVLALTVSGAFVQPVLIVRAVFYVLGFFLAALTFRERLIRDRLDTWTKPG